MLKEVEMQVTTASTLKIMLQNHEILWDVRCVLALFKYGGRSGRASIVGGPHCSAYISPS